MQHTLLIPTSLHDITLSQFLEYEVLSETLQDEKTRIYQTISIFCNTTTDEVSKIPFNVVNDISQKIETALSQDTKLIHTFEFNEIKYGFIPNLDTISTGEFIDIDTYQKERKDMHKLMSVLYRPLVGQKDKRYDIEAYEGKIHQDFEELPMDYVKGAMVFFCSLGQDLASYIQRSLVAQNPKDLRMQELQVLLKSGDGLDLFMAYVREMSLNLNTLLNYHLRQHYFGRVTS